VLIVWVGIAAIGYFIVTRLMGGGAGGGAGGDGDGKTPITKTEEKPLVEKGPPASKVELGIAYGTEKRRWLEWAAEQFAATDEGRNVQIKLLPMGSLEGAHAVLAGDKRIHVWWPASKLYRDLFVQEWQVKYGGEPIAKEERLALTPMVFVMWKERYEAFKAKYSEVSFQTIAKALQEEGGWGGIANKPEWGLFKFGHTHPNQSNSGLMSLVLMAYDFRSKNKGLTLPDIVAPEFQTWLGQLERGVSGLSNSTGNLMKEMVLKGPSSFDAVFVYESDAIEDLKNAAGRWGELHVVYPKYNAWNECPYYVLNTDWSTPAHRQAAETFLGYLLSEPVQKKSVEHGFHPGNPDVPVRFPDSPFLKYEKYGLKSDLTTMCEVPSNEVISDLQRTWQRAAGTR
jgi:Ca-activated chloride channel family protein